MSKKHLESCPCSCGCGEMMIPLWNSSEKRYSKYIRGHWSRVHYQLNDEQEARIVELYRIGLDVVPMSKFFDKIGPGRIHRALKRYDVQLRSRSETARKKYSCNTSYFDNIDCEEKAYWLGFIAADGHVNIHRGRYDFVIGLAISDMDHIKKFQRSVESNHPLLFPSHLVLGKSYRSVRLAFSCKPLVEALVKQGIPPGNKFGRLKFPNLQSDLLRHYCRGYIDGDGSFCYESRYSTLRFGLTGGYTFLRDLQRFLIAECNLPKTKVCTYKREKSRASYFAYGGRGQVERILNYLYKDTSVYLDRKAKYYFQLQGSQTPLFKFSSIE